jgi:hypothetical protein
MDCCHQQVAAAANCMALLLPLETVLLPLETVLLQVQGACG